jgi:hypothetical protein
LASVPSVARVWFLPPLSRSVTTAPAFPLTGSARLKAVAAAFSSPRLGPVMPFGPPNWARA